MRKYWVIFKVALAERFVYRGDFFLSTFLRFTPIITTIALWGAVYRASDHDHIGDLSYTQMVSYYLMVMVVRAFGSMPGLASGFARDVREGDLRKFILQPVNCILYHLHLRMAHKFVYFIMAAVPYALVFLWCRKYMPPLPPVSVLPAWIATLVLAFGLGFLINTLVGMLSFWFLEVTSFLFIFMVSQYFLSGHQFPLTLLPGKLQSIIIYLPFAYETFHPSMVLLGRYNHDPSQLMHILAGQAAWIVVLSLAVVMLWKRGLHRYSAFGG